MNKYLVIVVSNQTINMTETRKAFAHFYSKEELEGTDLKEYIPNRVGSCKFRANSDKSIEVVIKVL